MSLIPFSSQPSKNDKIMLDSTKTRVILDEFEIPCLLVDYGSRKILTASNSFATLTKFTLSEIVGINYENLIEEIPQDDLNDGFRGQAIILKKGDSRCRVEIEFKYVDPIRQLGLIKIKELHVEAIIEQFWEDFLKMGLAFQEKIPEINENDFIAEILRIGSEIFKTNFVSFYKNKLDKTGFYKISFDKDPFPDEIPAVEVERIKTIDYWHPGKRVLTEIQRAGRKSNIRHLFTIPIEFLYGNPGIFVVAYDKEVRADHLQNQFLVFKNWIQTNKEIFDKLKSSQITNSQLQNRNKELEFLIENISDSVLVIDKAKKIVGFNSRFCKLFNYSPVEVMGSFVETMLNTEISLDKTVQKQIKSEDKEEKLTLFRDRSGKEIPIFMEKLYLEVDKKDFWFIILQDAADYVHQSTNLIDLEKKAVLGDTIADFAHEVRNPINNIATGLQLLQQKADLADANSETIQRMQDDCIRMNYLMESILTFSRQKIKNFKIMDLKGILSRVIFRMKGKVEKAGHQLQFHCQLEKANARIDQRAVEQVLINLISNSLDAFITVGGIVSVSLINSETNIGFHEVIIADTGPGIPNVIEKRLFEPFVSVKPMGTGLGLAISKRIIENHNGKINVESFPGGTIFKIFLPIAEEGDNY